MVKCTDKELVVDEDNDLYVEYQLYGLDGKTPVNPNAISTMELTIINETDDTEIQAATDVKSEVDDAGIWKHTFPASVNAVIDNNLEVDEQEIHRFELKFTTSGENAGTLKRQKLIYVNVLKDM